MSPEQRGIALLAGLVLMGAISLLALVATGGMVLQMRMAGNFADREQARFAAKAALAEGEHFVLGLAQDQRLAGCSVRCFVDPVSRLIHSPGELPSYPEQQADDWWLNQALETGTDPLTGLATGGWDLGTQAPRFLLEEIHFDAAPPGSSESGVPAVEGVGYYRVLGRGYGHDSMVSAVLEVIVARPWPAQSPADDSAANPTPRCSEFKPWHPCGRLTWRQRL